MTVNYQAVSVTVPAGGRETVSAVGAYCRVLTAAQPFEISFGSNASTELIEQGLQVKTPGFETINLFNPNGSALTVVLAVSAAGVDDSRLSLPGSLTVSQNKSTSIQDAADVALVAGVAGVVVASNSARREAIITNITGSDIRVGAGTVGAARGAFVANGATIVLQTTAEVRAYSAPGGQVSVLEVLD